MTYSQCESQLTILMAQVKEQLQPCCYFRTFLLQTTTSKCQHLHEMLRCEYGMLSLSNFGLLHFILFLNYVFWIVVEKIEHHAAAVGNVALYL
jgi:hypothetical protein